MPCTTTADGVPSPKRFEESAQLLQAKEFRKSINANEVSESVKEDQIRAGFYKAEFDKRLKGTPRDWFYTVRFGAWVDPVKINEVIQFLKESAKPDK
jgi:hypothetical protein